MHASLAVHFICEWNGYLDKIYMAVQIFLCCTMLTSEFLVKIVLDCNEASALSSAWLGDFLGTLYIRGPQPLVCGLVLVCGLLGTGLCQRHASMKVHLCKGWVHAQNYPPCCHQPLPVHRKGWGALLKVISLVLLKKHRLYIF